MKRISVWGLGLLLVSVSLFTGTTDVSADDDDRVRDQTVTVYCGRNTIGAALAKAAPGGRLTIKVKGNCTEDVVIERDRVTLKDGTLTGTGAAQAVIQIPGARGIVIHKMTVQGGASHGISATRNADVTITDSTVQNNAEDGVHLNSGAFGDISGSTIKDNTNCAVSPREGASVLLTNNPLITTAQPNVGICATIGAYRSATVNLRGGNTITNTGSGVMSWTSSRIPPCAHKTAWTQFPV